MNAGNMQHFGLQKYLKGGFAVAAGLIVAIAANHGNCVDLKQASGVDSSVVDTVQLETSEPEASTVMGTAGVAGSTTRQVGEVTEYKYYKSEDREETIPEPGFWAVWFNPIGFIQFGPTAGVEFRTVPNLYVGIHGRYAAMGMVYNMLLEGRADEESYEVGSIEVYPESFGAGLEFKYYVTFPSRPNMLYFGMFSEYMQGGYTAFDDDSYISGSSGSLVPKKLYEDAHKSIGLGATLGHRWRFGPTRKVLLHVGLLTGVAKAFERTKAFYTISGGSPLGPKYDMPRRNEFIFMAEVGIGYGM